MKIVDIREDFAKMIESDVERHLSKLAKAHDCLCYKFTSPGISGVPDRILIGYGKTLFIETKAPGKEPRKLQDHVFEKMRKRGALVFVADTIEAVDDLFRKLPNI